MALPIVGERERATICRSEALPVWHLKGQRPTILPPTVMFGRIMAAGEDELVTIVRRGFEGRDLDYKAPSKWDTSDKKACCNLVKDVLAIANTSGGFIVIGVDETDKGFVLTGLTIEQLASWSPRASTSSSRTMLRRR